MNLEKLLHDHHIPLAQPGDSNYREGWVNTRCPFCSDHSMHLGFNLDQGYAHCWRCGGHWVDKAVAKLLGVSGQEAKKLLKQYGGTPLRKAPQVRRKIRVKAHKLPSDTGALKSRHKNYLVKRGFDPQQLAQDWGVLGTGPVSKLDKISYKHRILAPIWWDRDRVSFQTRDITGKHPAKYMACPEDRELVKHKHILYGRQDQWTETGICVEGITDVWRLGPLAFGTFGIDFTHQQLRQIVKHFMRVIIIFDQEPQAQSQARKLQAELEIRGKEVVRIDLKKDPADLTPRQAKALLKKVY